MNPYLKYRTRFTSSLRNSLAAGLGRLAEESRIPKSRLLDEAVEDLLRKYYEKRQAMRHSRRDC